MDGTLITLGLSAIAGIAAFVSVRTRVEKLEKFQDDTEPKIDQVLSSLGRIEGRFIESDRRSAAHGD